MNYDVSLVREGIGWKVSNVVVYHSSVDDDTFTDATATPVASQDSATDAAAEAGTDATVDQAPVEGDAAAADAEAVA